jgi:hypothetical protein
MPDKPAHWLYPIKPGSGHWFEDDDGQRILDPLTGEADTSVAAFRKSVRVNSTAQWYLRSGFHLMKTDDLIWIYAGAPEQAIVGLGRASSVNYNTTDGYWYVDIIWDREACDALEQQPILRDEFKIVPRSPAIRPGEEHQHVFDTWLKQRGLSSRAKPADDPMADLSDEDARIRVTMEVTRRQGQGPFRNSLLEAYSSQCAISGCDVEKVLEAAHIRPYNGPDTNDITNGLLLRSDLHTLFDLHLLTIDKDYRVVLHKSVRRDLYKKLHGKRLNLPADKALWPSKAMLKRHRETQ